MNCTYEKNLASALATLARLHVYHLGTMVKLEFIEFNILNAYILILYYHFCLTYERLRVILCHFRCYRLRRYFLLLKRATSMFKEFVTSFPVFPTIVHCFRLPWVIWRHLRSLPVLTRSLPVTFGRYDMTSGRYRHFRSPRPTRHFRQWWRHIWSQQAIWHHIR